MSRKRAILVTGGAGFIGCNLVRRLLLEPAESVGCVLNLDALTYAGSRENLTGIGDARHTFVPGNIRDTVLVSRLLREHKIDAVMHLAAESHVDRSIDGAVPFAETNVLGTVLLLEAALSYWKELAGRDKESFRFVQVSTDEVFGSLQPDEPAFHESTPYRPCNPYAATKAAGDHLARCYGHTHGLPVVVSNCSNNYGPHQYPEKLIPLMIWHALEGMALPVYGDGQQIRDWLFVEDHCAGLLRVLESGRPGESYHFGAALQVTNLELVERLCDLLDGLQPRADGKSYRSQISFVPDRPGHDVRYAMDARKAQSELGWHPRTSFEAGLRRTVEWYLQNREWCRAVSGAGSTNRQGLGQRRS